MADTFNGLKFDITHLERHIEDTETRLKIDIPVLKKKVLNLESEISALKNTLGAIVTWIRKQDPSGTAAGF
ncbi:hypothetical protein ACHAPJ_009181 [Fusarium lateritium]